MRGSNDPDTPISAELSIVKVLKESQDHALPLTMFARTAGMKIGQCQELTERLKDEGLVDIELGSTHR